MMTGLLAKLKSWYSNRRVQECGDPQGNQPIEIGSEALICTKSEDRLRRADFAD